MADRTARGGVLVVGGGFAGSYVAKLVGRRGATIVNPENFMLFTPLLAEVASGTLEPRHAVVPLRQMCRHCDLLLGHATAHDPRGQRVQVRTEHDLFWVRYEQLVIALGAVVRSLPVPGLAEHAVGFKSLADAVHLRTHVLRKLEAAVTAPTETRRLQELTFVFVGAGYAGVEALAEMESLVNDSLPTYPNLSRKDLRWVLIEARNSLLPGLDPRLARYSERHLRRRGVEILLETWLESCVDRKIQVSKPGVAPYVSETIVWATGQRPSPLVSALGLPTDEVGRLIADDHIRALGRSDVFALGDAAAVPDPDGGICPGTAQHAVRQAKVCAHNVAANLGVGEPVRFTYRNRGLAVTLGRNQGTAQVYRFTFTGLPAWLMGRSYHLLMMPGLARKARVVADWTTAMLFPRDLSQLGALGRRVPLTDGSG